MKVLNRYRTAMIPGQFGEQQKDRSNLERMKRYIHKILAVGLGVAALTLCIPAEPVLAASAQTTVVEEVADIVVSEGVAEIIGALIGTFVPRINGIRLSYKQNRFETRVAGALTLMAKRIDVMEANYAALTEGIQEKFRSI